ncbi:MAG: tetratricopeptide repeat protein [Bryobacterales bacterium]|nr:tetratricopeptide repeat protein [Bryobacterales bacterium]MDE0621261.1 tetratricopeptide repeat protein [Bryobacterales bacterium]
MPDRDGSQSVGARRQAAGARRVASSRTPCVRAASHTESGGALAIEKLIDDGSLSEAATALEARVADSGLTARNLLLRGLVAYRSGRYEAALPDLKQSFALDERDPDTSKALGMCLVRLGREDLADTFFQIAVRLAPDDAMARYYLGLNAYTTKRFDEAREAFREAVRLRPAAAENHSYLGRSYEALGQIDLARKHYLVASELNQRRSPPSADPPLLLGTLLFRQGRLDEAERYLRQALEYDDSQALPHYWLGLLFERESELRAAIRSLDRAAALAPTDHRPHYALARIHRRLGDSARAEEALNRFRELRQRSEAETF